MSVTSNISQITLKTILSAPTKLFKHFRRADDALTTGVDYPAPQQVSLPTRQSTTYATIIPGPWAFITSGYAITLVLMVCAFSTHLHFFVFSLCFLRPLV